MKSTLLSPKFQEWFINVTEGYPPPFVLVSDKKFHVEVEALLFAKAYKSIKRAKTNAITIFGRVIALEKAIKKWQ